MSDEVKKSNPWDRLEKESDAAWKAFTVFRDMVPPRRILSAAVCSHPTITLMTWAKDFNWLERAKAYDAFLDSIRQDERSETIRQTSREIALEHAILLKEARDLALDQLARLNDAAKANLAAGTIRPAEVIKLLDIVIKNDRLIRDQATEVTDHKIDLSKLTLEELEQLQALEKKAADQ